MLSESFVHANASTSLRQMAANVAKCALLLQSTLSFTAALCLFSSFLRTELMFAKSLNIVCYLHVVYYGKKDILFAVIIDTRSDDGE